jgi:tetratricopeptide (TPR) repeat protein
MKGDEKGIITEVERNGIKIISSQDGLFKMSPLHYAAYYGQFNIVLRLVSLAKEHDTEINLKDFLYAVDIRNNNVLHLTMLCLAGAVKNNVQDKCNECWKIIEFIFKEEVNLRAKYPDVNKSYAYLKDQVENRLYTPFDILRGELSSEKDQIKICNELQKKFDETFQRATKKDTQLLQSNDINTTTVVVKEPKNSRKEIKEKIRLLFSKPDLASTSQLLSDLAKLFSIKSCDLQVEQNTIYNTVKTVVRILEKKLNDDDDGVRELAVEFLAEFIEHGSNKVIMSSSSSSTPSIDKGNTQEIDVQVIEILFKALTNQAWGVKKYAGNKLAHLLNCVPPNEFCKIIEKLKPLLNDQDWSVRAHVIQIFAQLNKERLNDKSIKAILIHMLQDKEKWVREQAVIALGNLDKSSIKEALPVIIPLLRDTNVLVRGQVIRILKELLQNESEPNIFDMVIEQAMAEDLKEMSKALRDIGVNYYNGNQYGKALELYKLAEKIFKKAKEKGIADKSYLIKIMNNTAAVYLKLDEHVKALSIFKQALAMSAGEKPKKIAMLYHNIGTVDQKLGDYQEAKKMFKNVLEIEGLADSEKVDTLNNLGILYWQQKKNDRALEYFAKVLEINKKLFGIGSSQVAETYGNFGLVFIEKGDYQKALQCYCNALKIFNELSRQESIAITFHNIGFIYYKTGNYQDALLNLEKALKLKQEIFGSSHVSVALTLHSMGDAYYGLERWERALGYYQGALTIRVREIGENGSQVVDTLDKITHSLKFIKTVDVITTTNSLYEILDELTKSSSSRIKEQALQALELIDQIKQQKTTKSKQDEEALKDKPLFFFGASSNEASDDKKPLLSSSSSSTHLKKD